VGPVFDFSGLFTTSYRASGPITTRLVARRSLASRETPDRSFKEKAENLFIFNSEELRKRVKFNLQLISPFSLKYYQTSIYLSYFKEVDNFKIVEPTQLVFSKKEYYQKTHDSSILNVLSTKNLRYVQMGSMYFIEDLFGYAETKNVLCVFLPSFDEVFQYLAKYDNFDPSENIINVTLFSANNGPQTYILGDKSKSQYQRSIDLFLILINDVWFYGLILPNII
jgi:hypothetical protein